MATSLAQRFFDCLIRQHPTFAANVHPIIIVHRNSIQAASTAHSTWHKPCDLLFFVIFSSTTYYWVNPRLVQEQPQESGKFIVLICLYLQEWVIILWILWVHKDTHMARLLQWQDICLPQATQNSSNSSNSTSLQSSSLEQRKGSSSAFVEPTARNMAMSSLVGTSLRDGIFVATGLKMSQQFMFHAQNHVEDESWPRLKPVTRSLKR